MDYSVHRGLDHLEQLLMYGVANRAWVPCIFGSLNISTALGIWGPFLKGAGSTDCWIMLYLPLPVLKGDYKLYIDGIRVEIYTADANDYIDGVYIDGVLYTGSTNLFTDATNLTAQGRYDDAFTAIDCSSYGDIRVQLDLTLSSNEHLKIGLVGLRSYYAL